MMTDAVTELPARQLRRIETLLEHPSLQAAATRLGVSRVTLYRWMRTPAFQAAYRLARSEAFGQTIASLQGSSSQAIETLKQVMPNDALPAHSRVGAARFRPPPFPFSPQ